MLALIGLGLADETDITVKGLEMVRKAARVYLEAYTSILLVDKEKLVRGPFPPCHLVSSSPSFPCAGH
jgi:diphthamide biosynthesis methyltransferase